MALRQLEGPASAKGTALRGNLQIDSFRGTIRVRKWPRQRGPAKAERTKQQNEWFRQALRLINYMEPGFMRQMYTMTKRTRIYPRDLALSMLSGRAAWFLMDDGRKIYPEVFYMAVSDSLDSISQTPGTMLYRGPDGWAAIPPGTADQLLQFVDANAPPQWIDGVTTLDQISSVPGSMLYRTSTGWTELPPGTAGDFLSFVDDATPPNWLALPASVNSEVLGSKSLNFGSFPTFSSGFFGGATLVVPYACSATEVQFRVQAAVAAAVYSACVYTVTAAGALGALLKVGPNITGAVAGLNTAPFASTLNLNAGDVICAGIVLSGANLIMPAAADMGGFDILTGRPPPNPGGTGTKVNNTWNNFTVPIAP